MRKIYPFRLLALNPTVRVEFAGYRASRRQRPLSSPARIKRLCRACGAEASGRREPAESATLARQIPDPKEKQGTTDFTDETDEESMQSSHRGRQ
jgi:hypothetical protein